VSILAGNGDGTFAAQKSYAVKGGALQPWGIVVADLGNGHPDLAVTDHNHATGAGALTVLYGNGAGAFPSQQTYATGVGPVGVAAADTSGDGRLDLLTANYIDGTVDLLSFATGTTSFTTSFAGLADGVWYLHLCAVSDLGAAGAVATCQVRIDTTAPTTTASGLAAGANPAWSTANTVSLAASDALSGVTATYYRVNGGQRHTYAGPFALPDGVDSVTYWSVDGAGNTEAADTGYADVDTTAPVTTATGLTAQNAGWVTSGAVTVTLKASDGGSGMSGGSAATYYTVDGGAQTTYDGAFQVSGDGRHAVTYWSVDALGNTEAVAAGYVNIDTGDPSTTATGLATTVDPAWTKADTVSLAASDAVSGVAATYYTIDGGARQTYAGSFTLADGEHTVTYWSVDKAGNTETAATGYLDVDSTSPATKATGLSATADPAWSAADTVSLAATDALSGVAATFYKVDGGTAKTYSAPFELADGRHTVTFWSVDGAGNVEAAHTGYLDVDRSAPTTTGLSSTAAPAWTRSNTVTLTAGDALSGVAATWYTIDGGAQQAYSAPFTLPDGRHTVTWWSVDNAGNVEATHTGYVDIDTVGPTTYAAHASGRQGKPVSLRFEVRDALSARATAIVLTIRTSKNALVKRIKVSSKATGAWYVAKWTPRYRGAYRYTVTADDLAGNRQVKAGSATITVR
jgi:hypothetical protein